MEKSTHSSRVSAAMLIVVLSAALRVNAFAQAQLAPAQAEAAAAQAQVEISQAKLLEAQNKAATAKALAQAATEQMNATKVNTTSRQKFSTSVAKGWLWLQAQCTANPITDQCAAAAVLMTSNQCAASAKFLKKDTKSWQYLSFGLLLGSATFTGLGAAPTIAGSSTVPKIFSTLGGATGLGAVSSSANANANADQTALISINTTLNNFITYVTTGAAKGATAPPTIANGLSATGTVGVGFSYQVVATNSPTSFLITGLPAGLSANAATGLISGTPSAAGTTTVTLAATNASGTITNATLTLNITAGVPAAAPAINSAATASGTVGTQFGYQMSATNSPTSYAIAGGSSLPAGLSLNAATGFISGTPTAVGTIPVTMTATNASGTSNPFVLTFTIVAAAPAGSGPAPNELVYKVASLYAAQCAATALGSSNK